MLRFLHTADLQLGMPFHWVPGDQGASLRQARLDVIDCISAVAQERAAAFVLVAGDLFDANDVDDRVVLQACERLGRCPLPLLAIPGNHDHAATVGCVYDRPLFREACPDNLSVLQDREPLRIEAAESPGGVVLLPAPLRRRQEVGDTTDHLTADAGRELTGDGYRLGLAHGGVIDFSAGQGQPTNLIDPRRASLAGLDYLALGDWHSSYRVDERTWYSGAPEPTGFGEPDSGNVLVVSIAEPGAVPEVETVRVARTRWLRHDLSLSGPEDVDLLARWFDELEAPLDTLVRLEHEGTLPLEALDRFATLLDTMASKLLHLRRRGAGVVPAPSDEDLAELSGDGYLGMAVERLRACSEAEGERAAEARLALQLLYRIRRRLGEA